jgi:hypothetical protein
VILLDARTSCNLPEGAEGQVVKASVLLENGGGSGGGTRTVSMERSGGVRGVFVKKEPLDSGAESGGPPGTSGGVTGNNGECTQ